jgi:hypothetical protein
MPKLTQWAEDNIPEGLSIFGLGLCEFNRKTTLCIIFSFVRFDNSHFLIREEFKLAFGSSKVDIDKITTAIAEFEKTLITPNSRLLKLWHELQDINPDFDNRGSK